MPYVTQFVNHANGESGGAVNSGHSQNTGNPCNNMVLQQHSFTLTLLENCGNPHTSQCLYNDSTAILVENCGKPHITWCTRHILASNWIPRIAESGETEDCSIFLQTSRRHKWWSVQMWVTKINSQSPLNFFDKETTTGQTHCDFIFKPHVWLFTSSLPPPIFLFVDDDDIFHTAHLVENNWFNFPGWLVNGI